MANDILDTSNNDLDSLSSQERADEYFQIKKSLKTLRADLKDLKEEHEDTAELKELSEKVKSLRDKINNDESIYALKEKLATLKERQDLIKEIIKMQLLEESQEEIKVEGRKLKLIQVLKEMKDEENQL
jgi:hypothetical protein